MTADLIPSTEESLKALATDALSYEYLRELSRRAVGSTSAQEVLSSFFLDYEALDDRSKLAVDRVFAQARAERAINVGQSIGLRALNGDLKGAEMFLHDIMGHGKDGKGVSSANAPGLTVIVNGQPAGSTSGG